MSFKWINDTVARTPIHLRGMSYYGSDRVGMTQVGSKWTKWVRNGPSALDMYLMYLFEARAVGNGYHIFEGRSNMYVLYFVTEHRLHGTARDKMV